MQSHSHTPYREKERIILSEPGYCNYIFQPISITMKIRTFLKTHTVILSLMKLRGCMLPFSNVEIQSSCSVHNINIKNISECMPKGTNSPFPHTLTLTMQSTSAYKDSSVARNNGIIQQINAEAK